MQWICFHSLCTARRKKRGVIDEEDPFGMTDALDQLAFTQDFPTTQSDTATTVHDTKLTEMKSEPEKQPATMTTTEPADSGQPLAADGEIISKDPSSVAEPPMSDVADKAQTATTTPTSTAAHSRATTPARIPEKTFNDPLRDLILLSEVILIDDEEEFLQKVKSLAEDSSCLDYVLEVKSMDSYNQIQQQRKQDLMKSTTLQQGINLFQNPKDVVDPVKEAEFMKTLEALESTDDSDAVEKPVLGKISLVRRAKSAATRSSTDLRKTAQAAGGEGEELPGSAAAWIDIEVCSHSPLTWWTWTFDKIMTHDDYVIISH